MVINTAYSNTINGIDIPDELFYKLCEYRNRLVSDTAAGAKYEQDISVNELNYFFKSKVKYDALHYCCFCKVNYPISSQILNKSYSKQDRICLDGFPEISDFILPPECPFCRGICPDIISEEKLEELKYFIFSSRYEDLLHNEVCDRYIAILSELYNIENYGKYIFYMEYAKSLKTKNANRSLQEASFYLQKYLNEQDDASRYTSFELQLANIDLLRQLGNFDSAMTELEELKKKLGSNDSYNSILVTLEEHLISVKNVKSCLKPIGNKLHIAIADGIKPYTLRLPNNELLKLEGQLNCNGQTGLAQAIAEDKPEWIKYIIGVDKWLLSRKDSFGNGAMHISARFGNLAVVKLLQKLGCKIDEFNNQKQSPMFLAIRYGHFDVVDYLLSQGANPFIEDYKGNNALQLACIGKNIEGGRILNKLIKIAKIKQDTFETMIQKCYKTVLSEGCLNYYQILQKTGIKMNFSNISDLLIKKEFIPILAKEKDAEKFLAFDFCFSKAHGYLDKLDLYKTTSIYNKLLAKYKF